MPDVDPAAIQGAVDTSAVTGSDVVAAVVVAILTVVLAIVVSRLAQRWIERTGTESRAIATLAARAIRWVIVFIGAALALSFVGFDLAWFTLTIGLIAIVVVLVARPLVESLAASVLLTTRPAYTIGDDISVGGFSGEVMEITTHSTVLRLGDGRRVHIPNTDVLGDTIVVYTAEESRHSSFEIVFSEDAPFDCVERMILDALSDVPAIASDPGPRIRWKALDGGSVRLSIGFWHGSSLGAGGQALDQAIRATHATLRSNGVSTATVADVQKQDAHGGT